MTQVPASFRSAEGQPSASAMNVARCRAIAAHEAREEIRGPDYLAEIFLDPAAQQSLKDPATHALILKKLDAFSPGSYEYFIARTAYIDAIVEQSLREGIPQLVFFGAGYDTRAFRFAELIQQTCVFELDSGPTQAHKRTLLEQAHIPIPPTLRFVTVDFTQEHLLEVLTPAGYATDRWTLFVWEGVTYYLPPRAVEETLTFIRENSPPGSVLCFDYMITAPEMVGRYGAQQARAAMHSLYEAEPLQFDLPDDQVAEYLAARGFILLDHMTAEALQARYLTLSDGSRTGPILDLFRLVQAAVAA